MHVADQVISIFAGARGYFDIVPASEVAATEKRLLQFIRDEKSEVRKIIVETGALDDQTEELLIAALDEFRNRLETEQKQESAEPVAAAT